MFYSDIDLNMNKKVRGRIDTTTNQEVYDVRSLSDVGAIVRSLKNIILTGEGERRFDMNFGTKIFKSLFENLPLGGDHSFMNLKIREKIQKYEPRVSIVDIQQQNNYDQGSLTIFITFKILKTKEVYKLPVVMQRNR